MLSAVPAPASTTRTRVVHLKITNGTATQARPEKQSSVAVRKNSPDRDSLLQQAEAAEQEAARLRQKQTERDLAAAVVSFQKGMQLFRAASLDTEAANASLQIGEIYFTLSRYGEAIRFYQGAIHIGGKSPDLLCAALSRLARTYANTGEEFQADAFSKQGLSKCNALRDPSLQAGAWEARGEVLLNLGQEQQSAEFFSRAQELFRDAKDTSGQARSLLMLAYVHFHDDRAKVLQFAGEALRLWSLTGDRHGIAEVRTELGLLAAAMDEFETARCNYQESLPIFHAMGDKDNEAVTLNVLGYARREIGELEGSLEDYRHAKALFTRVHDRLGAGESITGMGKILRDLHQYQEMLPLYKEKLGLAQQTKHVAQEASALEDMAGVYELQRQYAKAKTFYKRSLAIYQSAKLDFGVADILSHLARLHARRHEDLQAVRLLEKARSLKEETQQAGDVARINYELACIYRRLGRLEDARNEIEKTIRIIESQRVQIASFDSRAAYFSSVHKYYSLYIQILMLLHRQFPDLGFARSAFEASERSKVRALLDLLNASEEESPCTELLEKQLAGPDSNKTTLTGIDPAVSSAPILTLKEIQAEIESNDTVVEYFLGDEKSYVWLVDPGGITFHELPKAGKIGKLVQGLREALTAREPRPSDKSLDQYRERVREAEADYFTLARRLSRLLLDSVGLEGTERLLIVPDGLLQYIPFSALPLPENDGNTPLISKYEVVMLPSASALGTLRKAAEKRTAPTHNAVVLADPVVEPDDPRVAHIDAARKNNPYIKRSILNRTLRGAQASLRITRLKGSRMEAEIIRQSLGGQDVRVAVDFAASRDAVLHGALEGYRRIHFATHGIIDIRHPEMSRLVLSLVDEKGQPQDGYLRLGDIYKLNLSADLVVLSACNSAMGKDLESEGIIGLPRGFLYAGSRSVIASLWKVDDDAAADFMRGFYGRIQAGASPSSALRGTQVDMSRGGPWSAPFYWAAFVLQGDYK